MSAIPLWVKLALIGVLMTIVGGGVLAYNHAIAKAERLELLDKEKSARILALEDEAMKSATKFKDLSDLVSDHTQRISDNQQASTKRMSYIERQHQGASNEKRAFLDTPMPEYRCVFERTCEAGVEGMPAQAK